MAEPDYASLLRQLVSDRETARAAAKAALYALDEDAVEPLVEQFYAGVSEAAGLAIIEVIGEIGGFEARIFLEDLTHLTARSTNESWRFAARLALARNGWGS